jgi:hypothetical protein
MMATATQKVFAKAGPRFSLLSRYRSGEEEQVWNDLFAAGPDVRREPLYSDALAVARETMWRARENVERLIGRLVILGYEFAFPRRGESPVGYAALAPVVQPELVDDVERRVGTLPLALRAWFEVGGGVNFTGSHPDWRAEWHEHPLIVNPLWVVFESHRDWLGQRPKSGLDLAAAGPYHFPISPAYFHAAPPGVARQYAITLPNAAADATLTGEPCGRSFVEYLRNAFRWGGFPDFERSVDRPSGQLAFLTSGLRRI